MADLNPNTFFKRRTSNKPEGWSFHPGVHPQLQEILKNHFESGGRISNTTRLGKGLGADSLDTIELCMAVEEANNKEMSDKQMERVKTVADLNKYFSNKKASVQTYITDIQKEPGKQMKSIHRKIDTNPKLKEAFDRGFTKVATEYGCNPIMVISLLKRASAADAFESDLAYEGLTHGLAGMGIGAGVGGMGGYMLGHDRDPNKDHGTAGAILGGLAGAGVGGIGGAYHGANDAWMKDVINPLISQGNQTKDMLGKLPFGLGNNIINELNAEQEQLKDLNLLKAIIGASLRNGENK